MADTPSLLLCYATCGPCLGYTNTQSSLVTLLAGHVCLGYTNTQSSLSYAACGPWLGYTNTQSSLSYATCGPCLGSRISFKHFWSFGAFSSDIEIKHICGQIVPTQCRITQNWHEMAFPMNMGNWLNADEYCFDPPNEPQTSAFSF